MRISYAITVCDEFIEIQRLIAYLLQHKRYEDEIVVLVDLTKNEPTSELLGYLHKQSSNGNIGLVEDYFDRHFANWKNKLTSHCSGDYIFQIDADEVPSEFLVKNLFSILESNEENEVYLVPRINTVDGLTQEHVRRWGWQVDFNGYVNFPDYQWRIYKNVDRICWINKVHEKLSGFTTYAALPADADYSLLHHKTIEKQEKQNNYYNTL